MAAKNKKTAKRVTKKTVAKKAECKKTVKKKAPAVKKDLDQIIKNLRKDPKAFTTLRKKFKAAKTDEKRVKILFDFAIDSKGLIKILPRDMLPGGEVALVTVTTVTVTTVTLFETDTAY